VILDEIGLTAALNEHPPLSKSRWESRSAIALRAKPPARSDLPTLLPREALNGGAAFEIRPRRDAALPEAVVPKWRQRRRFGDIEQGRGMGLVTMRERVLVKAVELLAREGGGALVRLTVPAA
jgi:hypothetical protein